MSKRILILFISIFLASCSSGNDFEGYMKMGKEKLIDKEYKSAIEYFDKAVIEKPSDKDANILLNRAKKSLSQYEFLSETESIYIRLSDLGNYKQEDISKISIEDANEKMIISSSIVDETEALYDTWSQDETFGEIYENLNNASKSLNEMFIAITEDISEPFVLKNKDYSMSEKFQYAQTTRDSKTRSNVSFTNYRLNMDSYSRAIKKFDI